MESWNPMEEHFNSPSANAYSGESSLGSLHMPNLRSGTNNSEYKCLLVTNIPLTLSSDGIKNLFSQAGNVTNVKMFQDKRNAELGIAYVHTKTFQDALKIIAEYSNFSLTDGGIDYKLKISFARNRQTNASRPAGSYEASGGQAHTSSSGIEQVLAFIEEMPQHKRHEGPVSIPNFRQVMPPTKEDIAASKRPLGRSKLLLKAAHLDGSGEPAVGKSRAANGGVPQVLINGGRGDSGMNRGNYLATAHLSSAEERSTDVHQNMATSYPGKIVTPGACLKCGQQGKKQCQVCKGKYCSVVCQKLDWPDHKATCFKYDTFEEDMKSFDVMIDDDVVSEVAGSMIQDSKMEIPEMADLEIEIRARKVKCDQSTLPVNELTEVILATSAVSPSEIWVVAKDNMQTLRQMQESLNEFYSDANNVKRPPRLPVPGDLCACQYMVDMLWYRAKVEADNNGGFDIRYVDYGNTETVPMSRLSILDNKFLSLPTMAVRCRLADIIPPDESFVWPERAIRACNDRIRLLECYTVKCVGVESSVHVIQVSTQDGSDMSEKLVKAGVAKRKSLIFGSDDRPISISPLQRSPFPGATAVVDELEMPNHGMPTAVKYLEKGSDIVVKVMEVVTPNQFWVQIVSDSDLKKLDGLHADMTAHYQKLRQKSGFTPNGKMLYATPYKASNVWHRVNVVSYDLSSVEAIYLDFGYRDKVSLVKLHSLEGQFCSLPFQAVCCSLDGVKMQWTLHTVDYFKQLIMSECLQAKVCEVAADKIHIKLLTASGEVVNDLLAKYLAIEEPKMSISNNQPSLPNDLSNHACHRKLDFETNADKKVCHLGYNPLVCTQKYDVIVTEASHISSFYVQVINQEVRDQCKFLTEKMNEHYGSYNKSYIPDIGESVAALYREDKKWYRGKVLEVHLAENNITVLFVDYGNVDKVSPTGISPLEKYFREIPILAHRCSLDIAGFSEAKGWKPELLLPFSGQFEMTVFSSNDNIYIVELINDGQNWKEELIHSGMLLPKSGLGVRQLVASNKSESLKAENKDAGSPKSVTINQDKQPSAHISEKVELNSSIMSTESLNLELESLVSVVHVDSPSSFWVQLEDSSLQEKFSNTMKSIQKFCISSTVAYVPKRVKEIVGAFYYGIWYRAEVLEMPSGETVKLNFLDFGNTDSIDCKNVREIPPEVSKECLPMAVPCALFGIASPQPSGLWNQEELNFFKDLCLEKLFTVKDVCFCLKNRWFINLLSKCSIFSVKEILLSSNHGRIDLSATVPHSSTNGIKQLNTLVQHQKHSNDSSEVLKKSNQVANNKLTSQETDGKPSKPTSSCLEESNSSVDPQAVTSSSLEKQNLPEIGDSVCLCSANTPSDFFVFLSSFQDKFKELSVNLNSYCNFPNTGIFAHSPKPGDLVAGLFEEIWYRAEVLKSVSSDKVMLQFIDFGNVEMVDLKDIRYMPERFVGILPKQAIKCSLPDLEPTGSQWNSDVTMWFQRMFENNYFLVKSVETRRDGICYLDLQALGCSASLKEQTIDCLKSVVKDVHPPDEVKSLKNCLTNTNEMTNNSAATSVHSISSGAPVSIVFANTPSDFYIQLLDTQVELAEMFQNLNMYCAETSVSYSPKHSGELVAGRFEEMWYRAEVIEIESGRVKLHFIDYGNDGIVGVCDIRALSDEFVTVLPKQAIKCEVTGYSDQQQWAAKTVDWFKKNFEGGSYLVKSAICDSRVGIWSIDLSSENSEQSLKNQLDNFLDEVVEAQLETGHFRTDNLIAKAGFEKTVDNSSPSIASGASVSISFVNTPSDFHIQLLDTQMQLAQLFQDINLYCAETSVSYSPKHSGELVAALFEGMWYRAEVIEIQSGRINLHFIDYGNDGVVGVGDIRALSEEFKSVLPRQAIKCAVAGYSDQKQWDTKTVEWFRKNFEGENFSVKSAIYGKEKAGICDIDLLSQISKQSLNNQLGNFLGQNIIAEPAQMVIEDSKIHDSMDKTRLAKVGKNSSQSIASGASVSIAFVNTPSDFYIQLLDTRMQLAQLFQDINLYCAETSISYSPKHSGELVAGLFEGMWYRAEVIEIQSGRVKLHFIDYGNDGIVGVCDIRALSEEFKSVLPKQAIKCAVAGYSDQKQWDTKTVDWFRKNFESECFTVKTSVNDKAGICLIDLISGKTNQSLRNQLENFLHEDVLSKPPAEVAKDKSLKTDNLVAKTQSIICSKISTRSISSGALVWIAFVNTPSDFYIQCLDTQVQLAQLLQDLNTFCEETSISYFPSHSGELVAGRFEGMWYRAEVFNIESGRATLHFIDYGNDVVVGACDIRALSNKFVTVLPKQAIKCTVAGYSDQQNWSTKTVDWFKKNYEAENFSVKSAICDEVGIWSIDLTSAKAELGLRNRLENFLAENVILPVPKVGTNVIIAFANSPSDFYIQDLDDALQRKLAELFVDLNQQCSKSSKFVKPNLKDLVAGLYEESWYRAEVIEILPQDQIKLLFVDYGNQANVSLKDIRELPGNFVEALPRQAIKSVLNSASSSWTSEQISWFKTNCENGKYVVQSAAVNGEAIDVVLIDQASGNSIENQLISLNKQKSNIEEVSTSKLSCNVNLQSVPSIQNVSSVQNQNVSSTQCISLGINSHVSVVHINSPSDFYVNAEDDVSTQQRLNLMLKMNEFCSSKLDGSRPERTGDKVAAKFDGMWYRAEILEILSNCRFKLLFIDFGNTVDMDLKGICCVPEEFFKMPAQAVHCRIARITGSEPDRSWSEKAVCWFQEVCENKVFSVNCATSIVDGKVTVDLIPTEPLEMPGSIRDLLLSFKFASETSDSSANLSSQIVATKSVHGQYSAARCFFSDLPQLEINNKLTVLVTLATSPQHFWCQDLQQMSRLMPLIEAPTLSQDCVYRPQENEVCLGFYEKYQEWYRAKVNKLVGDDVLVQLLDYGEEIDIPIRFIRPIPECLTQFAPLAFQCTLAGVHPVCQSGIWPEVARGWFRSLVELNELERITAHVVEQQSSNIVRRVALTIDSTGQSVAQELVKAGFAVI